MKIKMLIRCLNSFLLQIKIKMSIIIGTIVIIALFLWEHVAHINNHNIRPTWPLSKLIILSQKCFYYIGIFFGHVASLITYLHLDQIWETVTHIAKLIYELITSIKYMNEGINYVSSLFKNMYEQVYLTSVLLVSITIIGLMGLCFWYFEFALFDYLIDVMNRLLTFSLIEFFTVSPIASGLIFMIVTFLAYLSYTGM